MSKSFDLDKVKQQASEFSQNWQKKLKHLNQLTSREGISGAKLWLKSHDQIDDFKEALENLLEASEEEDFKLVLVSTTFSSFVLPEEDLAQADWYRVADELITNFQKRLENYQKIDKKQLTALANELKFISEADEFHERYNLVSIQMKVAKVYQELTQTLNELKSIEKEKLQIKKQEEEVKIKELEAEKAQAEAKSKMMDNVKLKEKRIAITEEKKRKIAEKEILETQHEQESERIELLAKQAEAERQAKLQDSYVELQLEQKINEWALADLIDIMEKKAKDNGSNEILISKISELKTIV